MRRWIDAAAHVIRSSLWRLLPQPPVIVVTGGQPMQHSAPASYGRQAALPAPYGATVDAREFKVVGEREGWIDEW